jgi:hypothetical protein
MAAFPATATYGQTTSFTYQGQLKFDGLPASGSYNLVFKLFTAASVGSQVGSTITRNGVVLTNGLLNQTLDFGEGAFPGDRRWIEVTVNGTVLTPRHEITATPYALSVPGLAASPEGIEVAGDIHTPGEVIASAFSSNSPLIFKVNPGNIECARIEDETCFLGLGTANPQARLHIGGTPGVDGIRFPDGSLQTTAAGVGAGGFWSASGTHIFNNNGGSVGIGTSGPAARLEVVSATAGTGDNTARFRAPAIGPNASHLHYGMTGDWYIRSASGTGKVVIQDTGGAVGIGTPSPQTKLHLSDPVNSVSHRIETGAGQNAWSRVEFANGNGQWDVGTSRTFNNDVFYIDRPGGLLDFQLSTWGGLGLGVEPQAKLHLFDPVNSVSHRIQTGAGTNAWSRVEFVNGNGQWDIGTSREFNHDVFYIDRPGGLLEFQLSTWGGLGLGVEPQAKLHLFDLGSVIQKIQSGGGTNAESRVEFANGDGQWNVGTTRNINGNQLYFHREGSPSIALGIQPNGNAFLQGTMSCKVLAVTGADVAEKFPSTDDKVEAGSVMEIDPDHVGKIRLSREAYSSRVAGVVSGAGDNPAGAVLGNFPGSENAPAIALSGRVWVRCDASRGAIAAGDMLTSSDAPGYAMKAADRDRAYGAVLGKAMSPLAHGERGLVLVLVNLQ